MKEWFAASDLAGLPGLPGTERGVNKMGDRGELSRRPRERGKGWEYAFATLPTQAQAALLKRFGAPSAVTPPAVDDEGDAPAFTYDAESLWDWATTRSQKQRDEGEKRAGLLRQVVALMAQGQGFRAAAEMVGRANGVSSANLRNWYYGVNHRPGAQCYDVKDWAAALIPGFTGRTVRKEIPPPAWDWFRGHYLTRRQPSLSESHRRVCEVALAQGWGELPAMKTFERRVKSDISLTTLVYLREGPEALARLYPPQRRDKTIFAAGEAVSGDGLKFDKLWVVWPDGEVLNTSTGWFWGDIRTNKILAYRLAKTENTDLFRLATYDLTAITRPSYAWVDNTVVAANKAMTGQAPGRHRFKDRPDDPIGLLIQLGIDTRFTTPPGEASNPGAKPIERSYGVGGLHDLVATSPRLTGRGYSRATAIPYEEFSAIVAEEVARWNARTKRRTAVCRGVLSFDEAFAESFSQATVRRATESQRQLLLLMPEVVTASRERGEIRLKAGRGPQGQNRYWTETLAEYKGQQVVAYYDPESLTKPVAVYTLDGRFICRAEHLGDVAFHDTAAGREWAKNKSRWRKAQKIAAKAEVRMNELEVAAQYPQAEAPQPPEPGIVQGNFAQRLRVANGDLVGGEDLSPERESAFNAQVFSMLDEMKKNRL